MKLTVFFILVGLLNVHAKGVSQTVTISGKDMPLSTVLAEVERQTGYLVFAKAQLLKNTKPVTVNVKNETLAAFIDLILGDQPLSYSIENKTIFIKAKSESLATDLSPRLHVATPPITVRGRIINEKGEPVIATIFIKGTGYGVTSELNGNFIMNNVDDNSILIITAANIITKEILVNGKTDLSVYVQSKINPLDEVVFKGYYKESKKLSTGNVSRVGSEDIGKQPVSNPLLALQGRAAGVQVIQQSGVPGGGINIQIRGQNSLRNAYDLGGDNGNYPLYMIDGVPFTSSAINYVASPTGGSFSLGGGIKGNSSPLSAINPNDIESIEILKDADATAIYGSRGANGVVLITTKKGQKGSGIL